MVNIFRGNDILKGIIFGLLSLFVLVFGSMAVLAGLKTENIRYYDVIPYYPLLVFNAIIAGLLGTSIALKLKTIRRLAYILNFVVFLLIIAGYGYFLRHRFSWNT